MSQGRAVSLQAGGTMVVGAVLFAVTIVSWLLVWRDASQMVMPGVHPLLAECVRFTLQWGVMMAAMMLPSAMPMFLMYRTVSVRLGAGGEHVVPVGLFAAVYLVAWLLPGVPLYLAHVGVNVAAARLPALDARMPYVVAFVLAAAGAYQFTSAKRACLRQCESPMAFLMQRWKGGYANTLRLAATHSVYCIGCCWGLMAILVVAGAMSLPWVLAIAVAVFAEKTMPAGWRTARAIGVLLVCLGIAVAVRPELAGRMRGDAMRNDGPDNMQGMSMPGMKM